MSSFDMVLGLCQREALFHKSMVVLDLFLRARLYCNDIADK